MNSKRKQPPQTNSSKRLAIWLSGLVAVLGILVLLLHPQVVLPALVPLLCSHPAEHMLSQTEQASRTLPAM